MTSAPAGTRPKGRAARATRKFACAGSCNNRWSQPVPRALEEPHIAENIDLFDFSLSDEEMRRISALRKWNIRIANPPERAPKWDVVTVD